MNRIAGVCIVLALAGCSSAKGSNCESNVQSAFSQYLEQVNADQPKVAKFFSQEFLADEVDDVVNIGTDHNTSATRKRLLIGREAKTVQRTVTCDNDECTARADAVDGKGMKWSFEFTYPISTCDEPKVSKITLIL